MRPVTIGTIVAALVIAAFVIGTYVNESNEGPAEEIGESIDNAAD
jgi:hypothetical protein